MTRNVAVAALLGAATVAAALYGLLVAAADTLADMEAL